MNKSLPKQLTGVNLDQLKSFLKEHGGDGWTIWAESKFTDMGFSIDILPVEKFKSDLSDPKTTIFKDGSVVEKTCGISNLAFLTRLATWLGVEYASYFGRGRLVPLPKRSWLSLVKPPHTDPA